MYNYIFNKMSKTDFSDLIGKAKQTQVKTLVQKTVVIPTPAPKKEKPAETIFSLYIPTHRLKALKIMAAENETSLKEMINMAIEEKYF